MTFDQTIALWCVVVPACVMGLGAVIGRFVPSGARPAILAISWFLAVGVALIARQGFAWWPDEAWRRTVWMLLAWAVILPATAGSIAASGDSPLEQGSSERGWRWVLAGTLACLTAMLVVPSGEAWKDTLPLHRGWIAAVTLSGLWNSFALESMARSGAARWCLLVALAGLGAPFALAAATYGSLAEWAMAMTAATAVAALAGVSGWVPAAWVVVFPCVAGAAIITASARFYTYQDYPSWIYAIALFTPLTLATVDGFIQSRPTWVRITCSAVTAAVLVGLCVWKVLLAEPF